jgi:hypothetical protein
MNILLILIAFILVATLAPFGILFNLLFNWKNRKRYFLNIAISLDQFGNVVCATLLNMTMLKGDYISFGHEDETISSCLGRNKKRGTLSGMGISLSNLLNKLDENHVEKSIEFE